jgi:hypothetical protein
MSTRPRRPPPTLSRWLVAATVALAVAGAWLSVDAGPLSPALQAQPR